MCKAKIILLFGCGLLFPILSHAQWRVLNPRILPLREGHCVDSSVLRSYHVQGFCTWTRPWSLFGVSQDGGASWSYDVVSIPLPGYVSTSTSFYTPLRGYYLGAANPNPFSFDYRLYYTSDGGGSWVPRATQAGYFFDWKFTSAREGLVFFFLGDRGDENRYIWITRDSGRTLSPLCENARHMIAFREQGPYLRILDSALWLSTDSGVSFHKIPSPARGSTRYAYLSDGHVWLVWTDEALARDRLSRSSDFGRTWETTSDSHPFNYSSIYEMEFRNALDGVSRSSSAVWRTTDGGLSWFPTAAILRAPSTTLIRDVMITDPASGRIVFMDGRWHDQNWSPDKPSLRFRRSSDFGLTWSTIAWIRPWFVRDVKRWSARDLVAIQAPSTEPRYSLYEPLDSVCVLISRDDGLTWTERVLIPGFYQDHLTIFPGGRVLVGASLHSEDYGETWAKTERPPGIHATAIPWFTESGVGITAAQTDSLHLVVLRSEDQGRSWSSLSRLELPYSGSGYAIRVIELPSGALHLTFQYTDPSNRRAVYRALSMDRGRTWLPFQKITPGDGESRIREPKTRDGKHYLVSNFYFSAESLLQSEDSGATYDWGTLRHRYAPTIYKSFFGSGRDYGWISDSLSYMVCAEGYCLSRDGGKTWTPEEGFPMEGVGGLVYENNQEQWFTGCYGLILQHRGPLGVLTSRESPPAMPRNLTLPITYPNPVSASAQAQVEFTLEREMTVGVYVHDILGRRQRVLHEGRLGSGLHRLSLRTSDLAPGLYFITISTPEGVKVGKMVVIRNE